MDLARPLVRFILEHAASFEWSLQGLGMLRLYLSPVYRLHVWSRAHQRPGVTTLHDHPWHFKSTVLSGWIDNLLYEERSGGLPYMRQEIVCGPHGDVSALPEPVDLICTRRITVPAGLTYLQHAEQIHETQFADGTVSMIRRTFRKDTEHAHVFYERGKEWVSAVPRAATPDEVRVITQAALERWEDST